MIPKIDSFPAHTLMQHARRAERMLPALPIAWASDLARQAREGDEAQREFREQVQRWNEAVAARKAQPRVAVNFPYATTKREAVAQFVDIIAAFAASVLATPADHPAHTLTFALALLDELTTFVKHETAATKGSNDV